MRDALSAVPTAIERPTAASSCLVSDTKQLIINADDLGLCRGVNEAVVQAHREGVLTSASLMATGAAFDHAMEHVISECPKLGIGAHICLTSGRSVLEPKRVPDLVGPDGMFRHGFVSLLRLVRKAPADVLQQIECEVAAQLEKIQQAGIVIDHVNSHRHVHMIPQLFEIVCRQAERFGRPAVRVSTEPWTMKPLRRLASGLPGFLGNAPKNVILRALVNSRRIEPPSAERTYGILGSGRMDQSELHARIKGLPMGVSELLTHPACVLKERLGGMASTDRDFVSSPSRQRELEALLSPSVREAIAAAGVQLTSFRDAFDDN